MRNTTLLPLIAAAAVLLGGCTMGKPGPAAGKAPSTAGSAIAGIGFQNDQFFKLVELGMKDQAAKSGVTFLAGNSGGSLDREISLVDTYIAQKVAAIVVAPYKPQASVPALQRAHQAGIKIVTYDSSIDAPFPAANIRSDQVSLGRTTGVEAVRYIRERMGGKANVAIVSYLSLLPDPASERNRGFEDEVRKLPGVQIVARQDAWMAEKAVTVVEAILTAHPEVNVIWAANEGGTVGAVTAVRNAGKGGSIAVFGTDISEQMCGFLLAGDNILQAVTGQRPVDIGAQALQAAIKATRGEPVEKQVRLPGQLYARREAAAVRECQSYLHGLAK